MSKYDYRDPATDPAYCAGLEPEPEDDLNELADQLAKDFEYWDEEPEGDRCIWCNQPVSAYTDVHYPYCSSLCEHQAERDSLGEY